MKLIKLSSEEIELLFMKLSGFTKKEEELFFTFNALRNGIRLCKDDKLKEKQVAHMKTLISEIKSLDYMTSNFAFKMHICQEEYNF